MYKFWRFYYIEKTMKSKKSALIAFFLTFLFIFTAKCFGSEVDTCKAGDIIRFGGQNWQVLELKDGHALIITENVKIIGPVSVTRLWGPVPHYG